MSHQRTNPRAPTVRVLLGVAGLALATLLPACTSTVSGDTSVDIADYDYRVRHPILISDEPEVLTIAVGMKGPALSPQIETAIRDYLVDYAANGTGGVTIQVPTGSSNEVAAELTGRAVHYSLVRAGVPRSAISVASYPAEGYDRPAAVRLAFLKVKAVTPKCGVWPTSVSSRNDNAEYENFGCAYQNNLAAMVSNPADLVRPRDMGPANGARRAKVITDYSNGDDTKSNATLPEAQTSGSSS